MGEQVEKIKYGKGRSERVVRFFMKLKESFWWTIDSVQDHFLAMPSLFFWYPSTFPSMNCFSNLSSSLTRYKKDKSLEQFIDGKVAERHKNKYGITNNWSLTRSMVHQRETFSFIKKRCRQDEWRKGAGAWSQCNAMEDVLHDVKHTVYCSLHMFLRFSATM